MNNIKKRIRLFQSTSTEADGFFKASGLLCDTGIIANINYTIEIEFKFPRDYFGYYFWGVCDSSAATRYHSLSLDKTTSVPRVTIGTKKLQLSEPPKKNTRYKMTVKPIAANTLSLEINDELFGSVTSDEPIAGTTYYLGGIHLMNSDRAISQLGDAIIYSFKIYDVDGTTLLFDAIPKKEKGKTVLFDTVSNKALEWF